MSVLRLFAVAGPALGVLALDDHRLRWLLPVACLAALVAIGELWLRALTAEADPTRGGKPQTEPEPTRGGKPQTEPEEAAPCRIGLGLMAGLSTLPLVALALHLLEVPIRARSVSAGLATVAALLGVVALLRERSGRVPGDPRLARTVAAVAAPTVVALIVGGAAAFAYVGLPHPPEPGYTSVALGGWAAGIDRPVSIPPDGLVVPLMVTSAGEPAAVRPLWIQVGNEVGKPRPVRLPVDGTGSVAVHVPAPPDDCLHRIEISLGPASTVFYGRGPVHPRRAAEC